jgi:Predicted permease
MMTGEGQDRAFKALVMAAAVVVIIAGLRAAQAILVQFLIAVFLAVLCSPVVVWLRRHRVPTIVGVILMVIVLMGVIGGFAALLGTSVNQFTAAIPRYQSRFNGLADSVAGWLAAHRIDVSGTSFFKLVKPGSLLGMLGGTLKGLVAALSNTAVVLLIMVFILLDIGGLPARLRAALGGKSGDMERFERMSAQIQQYLGIKTLTSLLTGILIGTWLAILGVDFALLWGVLAFLLNYVPNIGSVIAAIPAVFLALIQLGLGRALAAAIGFLVVNMLIGNFLEPGLMGRRLGLSTLVVFLSLVFWGWVWGPVGMLLSVPLTMIVKISLENSEELRWVAILMDNRVPEEERPGR